MKVAYVDTSCLVAVAFSDSRSAALTRRLRAFDELVSANLLDAELRSVFVRERVAVDSDLPFSISWIIPDRALTGEIGRVLEAGYVRGADCWHLASALYLAPEPNEATFLTLDVAQRKVAKALGFAT